MATWSPTPIEPLMVAAAEATADCQGGEHVMRLEPAYALGGVAVFCTCGGLTGFAANETDAGLIHAEHVTRAQARELEAIHPADGYRDGGTPYTDEELELEPGQRLDAGGIALEVQASPSAAYVLARRRRARAAVTGNDAA